MNTDESKITKDLAEEEFIGWCESNDIECDEMEMAEDEKEVFISARRRFVKAIRAGRLVIDGQSCEYMISDIAATGVAGGKIRIEPPNGNIWLALDGRKDVDRMHKMQQAMSALTGKDVGFFAKLPAKDWSFMMSAVSLFLS